MDTFNPSQMPPMQAGEPKKSSVGPLIAVIIILALIVIGGLYFLKERSSQQIYMPPVETQAQNEDAVSASLKQQSSSDEISSIEADLNSTNIDGIDQESASLEAELNQ